jgi:hypothetical protein
VLRKSDYLRANAASASQPVYLGMIANRVNSHSWDGHDRFDHEGLASHLF